MRTWYVVVGVGVLLVALAAVTAPHRASLEWRVAQAIGGHIQSCSSMFERVSERGDCIEVPGLGRDAALNLRNLAVAAATGSRIEGDRGLYTGWMELEPYGRRKVLIVGDTLMLYR